MDAQAEEMKVLLSEKEQADKQIGTYLELQLKMMAFIFPALAAAAGWVLSGGDQHFDAGPGLAIALLVILFITCFTILQGVVTYGIPREVLSKVVDRGFMIRRPRSSDPVCHLARAMLHRRTWRPHGEPERESWWVEGFC